MVFSSYECFLQNLSKEKISNSPVTVALCFLRKKLSISNIRCLYFPSNLMKETCIALVTILQIEILRLNQISHFPLC